LLLVHAAFIIVNIIVLALRLQTPAPCVFV